MKKLFAGIIILCILLFGSVLAEGVTPSAQISPAAPTNADMITLRLDRQYDRVTIRFFENAKNYLSWYLLNVQETELLRLHCGEHRLVVSCELNGVAYPPITLDFTVTQEDAEHFTYRVENGQAIITGYTGDKMAVVIPASVGGYPVSTVGARAFQQADFISVKVSEGIRVIDTEAFSIYGLETVALPQSLREIRRGAFWNCGSLTAIDIPQGVTVLGSRAFASCSKITSVRVPGGVTSIGYATFSGCSALAEVRLPDTLQTIGPEAFRYCRNLRNVTLPDALTEIGDEAFYGVEMTGITLPAGVTAVGRKAFNEDTIITLAPGNTSFRMISSSLIRNSDDTLLLCYPDSNLQFPRA